MHTNTNAISNSSTLSHTQTHTLTCNQADYHVTSETGWLDPGRSAAAVKFGVNFDALRSGKSLSLAVLSLAECICWCITCFVRCKGSVCNQLLKFAGSLVVSITECKHMVPLSFWNYCNAEITKYIYNIAKKQQLLRHLWAENGNTWTQVNFGIWLYIYNNLATLAMFFVTFVENLVLLFEEIVTGFWRHSPIRV